MQVVIHYNRPGKQSVRFREGFVDDNGARLRTRSIVPAAYRMGWSKRWQEQGLLRKGQVIHETRKYHFYSEYFGVMELRSQEGRLLGYYCDILTPLKKIERPSGAGWLEYSLLDLFLDLWVYPNGKTRALDWDEFNSAVEAGLLQADLAQTAAATLQRLEAEAARGAFPQDYIQVTSRV
jgi:protein associated with RNAse G/E